MIDKNGLNDENLSWKAKGLLAYLLSKPDDWQIYVKDLIKRSTDGRDSVVSGLKELEDNGYLSRQQIRGGNGKFGQMEYIVYEQPLTVNGISVSGKTVNGKPASTNNDLTNDIKNYDDDDEILTPTPIEKVINFITSNAQEELNDNQKAFVQNVIKHKVSDDMAINLYQLTGQTINTCNVEALNRTFKKFMNRARFGGINNLPQWFSTVLTNEQFTVEQMHIQELENKRIKSKYT